MGAIVGMLLVTAGMVAIAIVVWGKLQRQKQATTPLKTS